MLFILMFFLAFWAGFATRRASLCLVRATTEIIERKPAKTLFFVVQAMVIALSLTIPAMLFFPEHIAFVTSYAISPYLLAGSFLYGVGAFLNGSCALGTLNKLMNGKIQYLASIIGMALGFFCFLMVQEFIILEKANHAMSVNYKFLFLLPLMLVVWSVTIIQTTKFLKENEESKLTKMKKYITSSVARDYIGISIFGLCSGALYLIFDGSWDYTNFIRMTETIIVGQEEADLNIIMPILITTSALMIGMGTASLLSKDFHFMAAAPKEFAMKMVSGSLMGFSAGLIPGGNDTLILHSIPGLAIHSPIAVLTIMMAIAVVAYIKVTATKLRLS